MQVAEKTAALVLAKTGPTKEQVAAAEAKLASLQQERDAYAGKIDRTVLRMPFDGNILSLHLKDRINSYLEKGLPFASVENTGQVTAEMEIVESDIQYVKVGSVVRARAVSFFDQEFEGKVTLIDRNVTPKSFGNVVKVIATFDNQKGLLRTGMTGQAKIAADSMPVWKAFTLSITRFIKIQMWSWIP
jgi:putative peptide zinc metalloprotease protein